MGGTGWSVSYNWDKNYEIDMKATQCACDYYKQRNTGDNQWDKCEDCTFVCLDWTLWSDLADTNHWTGWTSMQLGWMAYRW